MGQNGDYLLFIFGCVKIQNRNESFGPPVLYSSSIRLIYWKADNTILWLNMITKAGISLKANTNSKMLCSFFLVQQSLNHSELEKVTVKIEIRRSEIKKMHTIFIGSCEKGSATPPGT